jgi:hypothetical protein
MTEDQDRRDHRDDQDHPGDRDAEQRARAEVDALRALLTPHGLGGSADVPAGRAADDAAIAALLAAAAAPTDPTPTDPAPTDPAPTDPAPTDPAPAPVVPLRARSVRSARRRWAVAAGVAAAAVGGVTIALLPVHDPPAAVALGSPPMLAFPVPPEELAAVEGEPARDVLLDLADAAAAQVDPVRAGTVQHVLSQSWLPSTLDTGDESVTTIEPTVRETWLTADGALTAAEWRGPDLRQNGRLDPVDTAPEAASVDRIPAGAYDAGQVAELPLEPAQLRSRLLELAGGEPIGCGPATADGAWCLYQGLTTLEAFVLPSSLESALWTLLADEPGVGLSGEVTDRAGRRAVGISVPAGAPDLDPVVRVLLVDAETGRLSGREEVTLSSELMDIDRPTVTTFRYELAADWVAEVGGPGSG